MSVDDAEAGHEQHGTVIPFPDAARRAARRTRRRHVREPLGGARLTCTAVGHCLDLFGVDISPGGCRAATTGAVPLVAGDEAVLVLDDVPVHAHVVRVERGPFGRVAVAFAYA